MVAPTAQNLLFPRALLSARRQQRHQRRKRKPSRGEQRRRAGERPEHERETQVWQNGFNQYSSIQRKKRRLKQTGQEGSEKLNGQREKSKQTNKQKQAEKRPPRNRTTSAEKRTKKEAEAERRRACLGPAWLCI